MDKYFDNTSMFKAIYRWKWHVIIITVVAAVCGVIFSGPAFITPLYESEAVVYPSINDPYSDETFTEQMIQVMQSNEIMDSVVKDFDLMEHYRISTGYKYWKTALISEYRENVRVSRTPYDAVVVKVLDKDPEIACAMVNDIVRLFDQKLQRMQKSKSLQAMKMYEYSLSHQEKFIDSLRDRLNTIASEYGVISVPEQSKEVSKAYINGGNDKAKELKKNLETYGPEVIALTERIVSESEVYSYTKYEYEEFVRHYNTELSFTNIVSEPYVSDKKAYPIRWVVVVLCGLGACLLSALVACLIERKSLQTK
ncbi:MAG: Wzz/FepE/Etk N-terminal domain-containing protein [Bacteroidales bacterium]|nr:Wzz/FepE/Etk N-terminal domain-containing protein [Bacteroidales bacterium]